MLNLHKCTHIFAHTYKHKQAREIVAALPRGFRFAVTKAADERAPRGVDKQIYEAAKKGKLDELLGLCQEWAGHAVIDSYQDYKVSQDT